ncbi:hypothetical protein SHJG_0023 [Streptomyces hygroscopicus subsp. jinggangensis 5008]|nr:hypothetical protein SHJG_0023 [Streptomyces hygroscopicus subsp. jinggangensis 5008]AGF59691.1 hypothetical protein SHJGH_0025 [Streptomyces hygroscopicus subsp. jinggangensis TL01]
MGVQRTRGSTRQLLVRTTNPGTTFPRVCVSYITRPQDAVQGGSDTRWRTLKSARSLPVQTVSGDPQ